MSASKEKCMSKNPSIETRCLHAGYTPANGEPRQLPIIQSTTYVYDTNEAMGDLFDLKAEGYFYTRLANPTCDAVAARIADLEGGLGGMLTSSGQSATLLALLNIARAGDHIVASSAVYGGTYNLIAHTMKRMGISSTFVDPDCSDEELEAAFQENTKAVLGETIANPALSVFDIERFAKAAHAHGVPLIVDNTFATPYLCRPIEHGADIVIHSASKYIDGHAASLGGAIVDSGNFDWKASGKFPELCTPDPTYHGIVYADAFAPKAYLTKALTQLMRDLGCAQSPQNAFYQNIGLETLPLRMEHVSNTALRVATALQDHPAIESVRYPGLPGDPDYEKARHYLPKGAAGVISFRIKGGRKAAEAFMKNLQLASIETHVADSITCCLHPASTTHRQMSDAELAAAGISPGQVRYSCGLEDPEDLIADLRQSLDAIDPALLT